MPRLRIPADTYSKARIIARRDGMDFRAWARSKALKYNGGAISCACKRDASVVVKVDVDLPTEIIRSAIIEATNGVTLAHGDWSDATISSVIQIENFWERECSRDQAIEILNKRLQERVSFLSLENKKTHIKESVI